jgi:hypothetical protein
MQETPPHDLLVAALWRFAHLQLARAPGSVDACARTAAARLALNEDVPLDALRALAAGLRSALTARNLAPRPAGWTERALGRLRLPRLRSADGGSEVSGDSKSLGKAAFYALGGVALTARDVAAAAEAAAAEVLDAPAASAQPGERQMVAESVRRLAEALAAQHAESLKVALAEAEETQRAAERARARAESGKPRRVDSGVQLVAPKTPPQTPPRAAAATHDEAVE